MLILDWTLIILNWKWSEIKTKNYFIELEIDLFFWFSTQNKTFLLWNENKNKWNKCRSKINMLTAGNCHYKKKKKKEEVKLICSWPGTVIQNRKCKISMFMAGNCRSLCRYASRLDQRFLSATALEFGDWISLSLTTECWRLSPVFIVTRRLEKPSILKLLNYLSTVKYSLSP